MHVMSRHLFSSNGLAHRFAVALVQFLLVPASPMVRDTTVLERVSRHAPRTTVAEMPAVPPSPPETSATMSCGVNCLFMFLQAWNVSASPTWLRNNTPIGPSGTSLLELQQTARKLGIRTTVYRCTVDELGASCQLPAIALLWQTPPSLRPRDPRGHYSLVLDIDPAPDGRVTLLDGSIGDRISVSKEQFADDWWSGYVLAMPKERPSLRTSIWATAAHCAAWAVIILFVQRKCRLVRSRGTGA